MSNYTKEEINNTIKITYNKVFLFKRKEDLNKVISLQNNILDIVFPKIVNKSITIIELEPIVDESNHYHESCSIKIELRLKKRKNEKNENFEKRLNIVTTFIDNELDNELNQIIEKI
jgi:hypothetical protein